MKEFRILEGVFAKNFKAQEEVRAEQDKLNRRKESFKGKIRNQLAIKLPEPPAEKRRNSLNNLPIANLAQ